VPSFMRCEIGFHLRILHIGLVEIVFCSVNSALNDSISEPIICDRYYLLDNKTWCSVFSSKINKPGIPFISENPEFNEKVNAFGLVHSKLFKYLPTKVSEVFHNLEVYHAINTAVKEVSYENFAGMFKLNELLINNGRLTKIKERTFKDLINLKNLSLGRKKSDF
jgi:hypothetical protein